MSSVYYNIIVHPYLIPWMTTMPTTARPPQTAIKQEIHSDMETVPIGHGAFDFIPTPPDLVHAHTPSAANNHGAAVHALSHGSHDMYAIASPHGLPYGVSNATNSYPGGGIDHPASSEVNDRCMGTEPRCGSQLE
ncbi:hypothetical protein FSARC_15045, partial [Fusarium sarcochroum]